MHRCEVGVIVECRLSVEFEEINERLGYPFYARHGWQIALISIVVVDGHGSESAICSERIGEVEDCDLSRAHAQPFEVRRFPCGERPCFFGT